MMPLTQGKILAPLASEEKIYTCVFLLGWAELRRSDMEQA
jgi:hypothetical protein